MKDPRVNQVARLLVDYSTQVKVGEKVYIQCADPLAIPLAGEVYREVLKRGAYPRINIGSAEFEYLLLKEGNESQIQFVPETLLPAYKECEVFIGLSSYLNNRLMSNLDFGKIALRDKAVMPVLHYRVNHMRWVVARYPSPTMAHDAQMSEEEFEEFYFNSILQDWTKQNAIQDKIKARLEKGKIIRIVGDNADISFSIEGRPGIKCVGNLNMPDGEIFFAPVEDSTDGHIEFTYPALVGGAEFAGVFLRFSEGKVVEARTQGNLEQFSKILDTDAGSRTLGEFGIGTNYQIDRFIRNTLFDEKIGGTIHLALGNCYEESKGTNCSAIHIDIVKDLRKGGKMFLDGELIQENGKFLF